MMPTIHELVAEQEAVQAEKFQGRMLRHYNSYFFPGQEWCQPLNSAVTDFMRPYSSDAELVSLENVLDGVQSRNEGQSVHWADMGGGRGLTMRQLATMPRFAGKLIMTNVDLFDYGLDGLSDEEIKHLESLHPGITKDNTRPTLIRADIEAVTLPEPAGLITSVESMQYLNNPLAAIGNWYNQLRDNGLLMIATEDSWASWIRYQQEPGDYQQKEAPVKHLFDELGRIGVNFAATDEPDYECGDRPRLRPSHTRDFVVQKKPGTRMVVNADVTSIWKNPWNYKAVYYSEPQEASLPLVEIVSD